MNEIPVESKNYAHTHNIVFFLQYSFHVCVHICVCTYSFIIFFIPLNTGNTTTTLNTILQPCSTINCMLQEYGFSPSVLEQFCLVITANIYWVLTMCQALFERLHFSFNLPNLWNRLFYFSEEETEAERLSSLP